jgi:hypothetical protein
LKQFAALADIKQIPATPKFITVNSRTSHFGRQVAEMAGIF